MDNEEAWKRAQFADQLDALKLRIEDYEAGNLTVDAFIQGVVAWKGASKAPKYDVALEAQLRKDWVELGDVDVFRRYNNLGLSMRDMARVCGVSASAITRWLNGTRERRA